MKSFGRGRDCARRKIQRLRPVRARRLYAHVEFHRPPIPKGLPLEAVQKMQQDRKRAEEAMVAHFYLYASEPSNILTVKDAESYQASRSYALRGSRGDDLKEAFYSSSATIDGIASSRFFPLN